MTRVARVLALPAAVVGLALLWGTAPGCAKNCTPGDVKTYKTCSPDVDGGSTDCSANEQCLPPLGGGAPRCFPRCQAGVCNDSQDCVPRAVSVDGGCGDGGVGGGEDDGGTSGGGGGSSCRTEFLCFPATCN